MNEENWRNFLSQAETVFMSATISELQDHYHHNHRMGEQEVQITRDLFNKVAEFQRYGGKFENPTGLQSLKLYVDCVNRYCIENQVPWKVGDWTIDNWPVIFAWLDCMFLECSEFSL